MMEGGENKESKASVEDTEPSEQVDDEARARRFYECIFCKRGFSTAQALGGHMNIHRKDRAKMRPALIPSVTENPGEGSERYGSHHLIPSHQSSYPPFSESLRNYAMYFPASSASSNPEVKVSGDGDDDRSRRPQELSLFGEELHSGLRVHGGDGGVEDREERKKDGKEEELDLELRLGHDQPEARS